MEHIDKTIQLRTAARIGVLAGGSSAERDVSLRTGNAILKALKNKGYDAVMIDAGRDLCSALVREQVGIAFIALHGGTGENGAVQGLLEVMGMPYTGSGVLASALAMDKEASKKIFLYHGIPVTPFQVVRRQELDPLGAASPDKLADGLAIPFPMPWVVKPSTEGSSVGVNIVKKAADLPEALQQAFAFGPVILVESHTKGKEIQIGILGENVLGGVEVRPSLEYYSYEAKYTPGLTDYILPPDIPDHDYGVLKDLALRAHKALGCSGATRVDLILDSSHNPYVLEVNTIPGMTETSLLPKIARLSGIEFPELVEEILAIALP